VDDDDDEIYALSNKYLTILTEHNASKSTGQSQFCITVQHDVMLTVQRLRIFEGFV
jgi:hypothetical protein